MVRPFGKAAAAAVAGEASFADELLDFNADLFCHPPGGPASSTSAGDLQDDALLFRDFFGPGVDGLLELPAEGEDEEEELEWLVNKDAFPGVETSFEVPTSSGGGSGSRGSAAGGGGGAVAGERPSPISVLAAAGSSVPVKPRSRRRRMQRRVLTGLTPAPDAVAAAREGEPPEERRRCRHCQAEETPQWRRGPEGPKTLCNACGVRYKSGRLLPEYRPASSPTFSADIHSNSHRRIMEMRPQKTAMGGAAPACSGRCGALQAPPPLNHFPKKKK